MSERKRISLLGVPMGLGAGRYGSEAGDRAVRTEHLQAALENLQFTVEDCGSLAVPDAREPGDRRARFLREITSVCSQVADWMQQRLAAGSLPLVLGGDHSIAAGTIAGSAAHFRAHDEEIGLIWIDAHGDMNTPATSPSGNVHGMPLAASLGLGPDPLSRLCGFHPKVNPARTVIIGARDIDPTEFEIIDQSGVQLITIREIDERGMFSVMSEAIEYVLDGTAGFHVSLDMDALDPTVAPGVGTPVPGGLTYREAHLALEMIADTARLVSMDVVEVNPMLDATNITARTAVALITSAFGKRIIPRRAYRQRPEKNGREPAS